MKIEDQVCSVEQAIELKNSALIWIVCFYTIIMPILKKPESFFHRW